MHVVGRLVPMGLQVERLQRNSLRDRTEGREHSMLEVQGSECGFEPPKHGVELALRIVYV